MHSKLLTTKFWFGLVLLHINHYRLFNGKSCFYISNIWFVNTFFRYTQSNDQTVLFLTIQFSISHLFTYRLNVKPLFDPIRCYHFGPEWTWEWWQWRDTQHYLKLQYYWNLTIRLFNVVSRTLVGGRLPLCRGLVGVFYSPSWVGNKIRGGGILVYDIYWFFKISSN